MRPYLVFMRTGAAGLYPRWLAQEPERNWDLFLSCYAPLNAHPEAVATVCGGYNKLDHFRECVRSGQIDLRAYRYVLLADDDLEVVRGSVSDFFRDTEAAGLSIAHPAQCWTGYWSHRIMMRNPLTVWRETSFVEVMSPCFESGFLARRLEDFPITRSTWGCDHAFCHVARSEGGRIGILDDHVIRHTKPILASGAFYQKLAADGVDPDAEFKAVMDSLPEEARRDRLLDLHVAPGLFAGLRRRLAFTMERRKRQVMKLCGHHQRFTDDG